MASKKDVGTKKLSKRVPSSLRTRETNSAESGLAGSNERSRKAAPARGAVKRENEELSQEPTPRDTLPFEIDGQNIESSLEKLKAQLAQWAKKGRYTRVRFKFRGKQLLPDIPLAVVAAFEGATFYWAGILRVLVFNLAGRAVIDIELVNESEKMLAQGKEALLTGDLAQALKAFEKARDMDPENPLVFLNLGIAQKLKMNFKSARANLEQAKRLDSKGPIALEANKILDSIP
jgi:tetratricopeptide (TPR) repeat protein